MTEQEIIKSLAKIKKGTYIKITFIANPHVLKAGRDMNIEKISNGVFRVGIDYSNLKANADKILSGNLNGVEWKDGCFDYLLQPIGDTNKSYLRVYTTNHHKTHSKWFIGGKETTKEELIEKGLVSASKSNATLCFNLNIENIISIG